MSAQALVSISGTVTAAPSGSKQIGPFTIFNTSSGEAVTQLTSLSGDNTITVPLATLIGCIIVPPAGNLAALKLKGSAGDVGLPLHLTFASPYIFPAGTSSFILNVGSAGVAIEITWF
jgi:hypothetical protein